MQVYQKPSLRIMSFHQRLLPPDDALHFVLPLGPSVNHLYVGTGKTKSRSPEYRAWSNLAAEELMVQRAGMQVKSLARGRYCAAIMVSPRAMQDGTKPRIRPDGGVRTVTERYSFLSADMIDLDNRLKAIFDVLKFMRITPDDRWLYSFIMTREPEMADNLSQIAVWSLLPGGE